MIDSLAAWELLYVALSSLSLAGIAWNPPVIAAAAAGLALAAWRLLPAPPPFRQSREGSRSSPGSPGPRRRAAPGWGDGLAALAVALFTAFAMTLWITISDFVLHWGLKGRRFYVAHGIDYAYLAQTWNWVTHPDYPNLLPVLYAVTAFATGGFDARAMMVWSVICFVLLLLAVREALRRTGVSRFAAQAALAIVAMALGAFAIGGEGAGSADWLIALALAAAMPPLLAPPDPRGAAQVGVIAAFAASSKMEGIPLGVFLIAIYGWRLWAPSPASPASPRAPRSPARELGTAAALALPILAAAAPWLLAVRRHHLFLDFNAGHLVPARAGIVLPAIARMLHEPAWCGFPYTLACLPLLALDRRLRPLAALLALQLAFYLYVFFSVRIDPVVLIQLSFGRLAMHLLPALLTAAVIALDRRFHPPPAAGRETCAS